MQYENIKILYLSNEDKRWKKSRHAIAPSFNYNIIVDYIPIFEKEAKDCVRQLRKYVGHEPFNICEIVERSTIVSFFQSIIAIDISPELMQKYAEIVSEYEIGEYELIKNRIEILNNSVHVQICALF